MRSPLHLVVGLATGLVPAVLLTGCSDFPAGDPNPSTVRVYLDRDFDQTWQLAACDTAGDESLSVTGTNTFGERIAIEISGGSGSVTVFADTTTISLTGTIDDYDFDSEEQLFDAEGEYRSGEQTGRLELAGNCTPA
jgi:hypothetical protein